MSQQHRYVTSYTATALNKQDLCPGQGEVIWVRQEL